MLEQKYLIIVGFILYGVIVNAQVNGIEQLKQNPNLEVKLLEDGKVEVYDKRNNYRYYRTIKEKDKFNKSTDANLIIELDTVNFAAYENYYREWGSLPAVNWWYGKYTSIDANDNGKNEVYIFHTYYSPSGGYSEARIYEQTQDSLFSIVYEFPDDTLGNIYDVGDLTGDGFLDILIRGVGNKISFFKQQTSNSYINTFNFIYNPFPPVYQPNNATLYDIDSDGNLEMIYFLDAGSLDSVWGGSNHIAKYNTQLNNFELIYYNRPQPEWYTNGIATGDFDQDGKGNFATGSIGGKLFVYEHVQNIEYQVEYTEELSTYNAYLTVQTNDMDGNGKPELWIGGDFASSMYGGVTRLFAYEASSLGVYEQVYQVDIRGLFSFIDGKMRYVDLDGDGKKELFLTNANLVFCFKYDGNGNYFMDFVIQAPILDSIYTTQNVERIDVADLDGDDVVEIIPQYFLSKGWDESWEDRSVFLKRDKVVDVENNNENIPDDFILYQNYPNPFNPETKIKFALPSNSEVRIKIYNTLGKEIKELINETRNSGEYEITWNGTVNSGNKVPSGIYFITMTANTGLTGEIRKTIKSVLLK